MTNALVSFGLALCAMFLTSCASAPSSPHPQNRTPQPAPPARDQASTSGWRIPPRIIVTTSDAGSDASRLMLAQLRQALGLRGVIVVDKAEQNLSYRLELTAIYKREAPIATISVDSEGWLKPGGFSTGVAHMYDVHYRLHGTGDEVIAIPDASEDPGSVAGTHTGAASGFWNVASVGIKDGNSQMLNEGMTSIAVKVIKTLQKAQQ